MNYNDLKDNLAIASDVIAIISFVFIIARYIANYKYGKKFENRFKIPYNLFTFNIEIVLVEAFEYILSLTSIILLMLFSDFSNKSDILLKSSNYMLMFVTLFLYMIGTVGIIKEMYINPTRERKYSFCCEFFNFIGIYILIPALFILLIHIKIITISTIIILMVGGAVFCVYLFFKRYFDFDKKKYEIVKDEDGNSVAIIANSKQGFIVVDVIENNGNYKIREVGNYRIVDKVSLVNRKYGIINV